MSNYSGMYHSFAPETIKAHLFFQMFNPVRWMWQLQRALADGVEAVIEFGGGVGAASHPAGKVPNLQGITRAAIARTNRATAYCAGISAAHLKRTARFVNAYSSIVETSDDRRRAVDPSAPYTSEPAANGQGERWFHLYVPTVRGTPIGIAVEMIRSVAELALTDIVQIVAEPVERNVETLKWLDVDGGEDPQPYLEVVYACEAAAVLYYVGPEILPQLTALVRLPPPAPISAVA
jgi:malonyl CoA-acyl carrier protein transacylase